MPPSGGGVVAAISFLFPIKTSQESEAWHGGQLILISKPRLSNIPAAAASTEFHCRNSYLFQSRGSLISLLQPLQLNFTAATHIYFKAVAL